MGIEEEKVVEGGVVVIEVASIWVVGLESRSRAAFQQKGVEKRVLVISK